MKKQDVTTEISPSSSTIPLQANAANTVAAKSVAKGAFVAFCATKFLDPPLGWDPKAGEGADSMSRETFCDPLLIQGFGSWLLYEKGLKCQTVVEYVRKVMNSGQ